MRGRWVSIQKPRGYMEGGVDITLPPEKPVCVAGTTEQWLLRGHQQLPQAEGTFPVHPWAQIPT